MYHFSTVIDALRAILNGLKIEKPSLDISDESYTTKAKQNHAIAHQYLTYDFR